MTIADKLIFNSLIIIGTTSKCPPNFLVEINNKIDVTIDAIVDAIATPNTPNIFDKVILKIILTTTPIIPLIVVTLVFCIENNDEFKISLTPVNGNTNEYPKKALAVIFTAASLKLPLS